MGSDISMGSLSEKLKAVFALGVSCNLSTLIGITASWVFLSRAGCVEGFWQRVWISLALLPAFMADALNAYVLGRIRLEHEKGWNDIQITDAGRHAIVRMYYPWRIVSFLTSTMFAASMLASFFPNSGKYKYILWIFVTLFGIHGMRCFYTIYAYMAPRIPTFGGKALLKRIALVGIAAVPWIWWMVKQFASPKSCWVIFLYSIIYFIIAAVMQPLPSKFSIFRAASGETASQVLALKPIDVNAQEISEAVRRIAERWRLEHGFTIISGIRMPLLEMPIFKSVGIVMLSPDGCSILLILQSESNSKPHRTLVSWNGDNKFVLTSDLEMQISKAPDSIVYAACHSEEGSEAFWNTHALSLRNFAAAPISTAPWHVLQSVIAATAFSLAEGLQISSNAEQNR